MNHAKAARHALMIAKGPATVPGMVKLTQPGHPGGIRKLPLAREDGGGVNYIPPEDPQRAENLEKFNPIKDEQGNPKVLYHGTTGDFSKFSNVMAGSSTGANSAKLGHWFTDNPRVAQSYANYAAQDAPVLRLVKKAEEAARRKDWAAHEKYTNEYESLDNSFSDIENRKRGQNILPVHVSMKNPHIVDAHGGEFNDLEGGLTKHIQYAKKHKHDGLIIKNLDDAAGLSDVPATHYMVFHPHQIKSAIGNQGTFDPNTPDITKAGGGDVEQPDQKNPQHASTEPPAAAFEIAPGKTWNPAQQASWEQLHPQAKAAISNKMIGEFLSRWQRNTGMHGEVRPGLGGFGGHSNPNYTFHPYNPEHIAPALHGLGELFRQDAMMGAHAHPFEGSQPSGVVRVHLPKDMHPDEVHEIYKTLGEHGLAEGHSSDLGRGTMDILAGSGGEDTQEHAKNIDKVLGGKYDVSAYPTNISFPEHGANYGISRSQVSGPSGAPTSSPHGDLQAEAQRRLTTLLQEAHRQGGGHKGEVSFGDTLSPGQIHTDTVSAAMPTTVKAYKGPPMAGQARTDVSPSLHSEKNLDANAQRMWKQHPASGGEELPGKEALRKLNDFQVKNLLALWDRTPPAQRQTSRFWYRAAHALGNSYAEDHKIMPRAAHAIMAVLSPQNPWDKNVTQAERVMDVLHHHQDTPWTAGMTDVIRNGGAAGKGLPQDKGTKATGPHKWSDIEGKTLKEVLQGPHGEQRAAMWVRAFDEAHNPTEYRAVSPTGEFMGTMMNKSGSAPDTASWNSYLPIQKAISVWHDPSVENINQQIGRNHKVREFYNVITNPNDPNGVVIDTHAVAAGQLLPHGSSAKEVNQNFGTSPGKPGKKYLEKIGVPWEAGYDPAKKTASTGATGDYPVHAEAVRQAAWARGVHPSEMQSVTWERVRTLFSDKGPKAQRAARDIWKEYAAGNLNHGEAVDKIFNMLGKGQNERAASWHGAGEGKSGLGDVKPGSYVRPTNITAETPASPRHKLGKSKPEEEFAHGGDVDRALRLTSQLNEHSPDVVNLARQYAPGRR